ncbi:MAG: hypothetical protein J7L15_05375 [Clostridiales bacterium]|nr:hypothetical protein [Clostridiales bacterium]
MNKTKLVKIFPIQFWGYDTYKFQFTVNGEAFLSSLDNDIGDCYMKSFFGKIHLIEIHSDVGGSRMHNRESYFTIINQEIFDSQKSIFEWDMSAIQEELAKEDYPEYFL